MMILPFTTNGLPMDAVIHTTATALVPFRTKRMNGRHVAILDMTPRALRFIPANIPHQAIDITDGTLQMHPSQQIFWNRNDTTTRVMVETFLGRNTTRAHYASEDDFASCMEYVQAVFNVCKLCHMDFEDPKTLLEKEHLPIDAMVMEMVDRIRKDGVRLDPVQEDFVETFGLDRFEAFFLKTYEVDSLLGVPSFHHKMVSLVRLFMETRKLIEDLIQKTNELHPGHADDGSASVISKHVSLSVAMRGARDIMAVIGKFQ